ncbi:phosphoethanolamine transferase [Mariniflexile maritimum]|uniref:phosphoethanolamine transferase n=1 Tax=Mariniflexile maritimum TaxID=2682493 RepID=UPI0012F62604|nr:phosphoethanolamine transferase [Mariniflexile maritimum]
MKIIKYKRPLFYLFLFPIILAFSFESVFKSITLPRFFNLTENLLFAILIVLFSFLITGIKYKKLFLTASVIVFNLCLLFETLYYYLFDNFLSASAIFVVLESNSNEIKEFLSVHFDRYALILVTVFFLNIIYISFKKRKYFNAFFEFSVNRFLIFELLLMLYFVLKLTTLIVYNVPYILIKAPVSYYQEMKKFKNYGKENKIGNFTNVKHNTKGKELYVIVLGESTSKRHFNLYNNYYRETTPLLNSIKDDLFVFNNVISAHTYTIGALSKALTLGNYENPEAKYNGTIIQLFNQANFQTYWISNQRPVGMMDTHITKIGLGAGKSFFLNTKHTSENTNLDDELIKKMREILLIKEDKKIIFLHMLGTHLSYKNRFPANQNYFKDMPKTKFNTEKAYKIINDYDNAIRYNDKLLKQIIDIIKAENKTSYVLYFSDHGQEVFDDIDFSGHTIDEKITKSMYEIPMFLWVSDKYKSKNNLKINIDNKYMTDDMFHSIADISNVTSDQIDSTRSIFNEKFKERKRIIKDTIDFDFFFNRH